MKMLAWVIDFIIAVPFWAWLLSRVQGSEQTIDLYNQWLLIYVVGVVAYYFLTKKFLGQTFGNMVIKGMGKK